MERQTKHLSFATFLCELGFQRGLKCTTYLIAK